MTHAHIDIQVYIYMYNYIYCTGTGSCIWVVSVFICSVLLKESCGSWFSLCWMLLKAKEIEIQTDGPGETLSEEAWFRVFADESDENDKKEFHNPYYSQILILEVVFSSKSNWKSRVVLVSRWTKLTKK